MKNLHKFENCLFEKLIIIFFLIISLQHTDTTDTVSIKINCETNHKTCDASKIYLDYKKIDCKYECRR